MSHVGSDRATRLVGIVGKAGSGKTTFANHLCDQYGFSEVSFADELKRLCCEQFGWDREALYYDAAAQQIGFESSLAYKEAVCPQSGQTRRRIMQHLGTEGFRALDPDHWVKITMSRVGEMLETNVGGLVFPDVRFLNEIQAIRERGGVIIELRKADEAAGTAGAQHASELEWQQAEADFVFAPKFGLEFVRACADDFYCTLHGIG